MKIANKVTLCAFAIAVLSVTATANAQIYEDGLDDASADVKINAQADTTVRFVDYSNLTVGAENFNIPEAPRQVAGSAAQSGVWIQSNLAGAASGANVLAGATPLNIGGDYKLSFDAWINVADPVPSGGTEQLLWGTGNDDAGAVETRNDRANGVGVWGWLAGENGYGTEDAAIFVNGTEAADLGDTQPNEAFPFNNAFTTNFGLNNVPANSWVQVDINSDNGRTLVRFNGVPFFDIPIQAPAGAVMFGYEDPFGSISDAQDFQWGLFDNFVVTEVPEPTTLALAGLCAMSLVGFRRR